MVRKTVLVKNLKKVLFFILSALVMLYLVFPVLWLLLSSFKRPVELFSSPPTFLPHPFVRSNFSKVLSDPTFLNSMKNSFIIASFTTVFSLVIGVLAAYVFARDTFKGKRPLLLMILGTQMLPFVILLIPLFIIMRTLHLIDTYLGLILAYMTFSVPYAIWLLQAFFKSIPFELEEAGMVDGCTRLGAIRRILIPLSAPGFTSTGIFIFIGGWNHYLFATVLSETVTKTFPLRMADYMGQERIVYEQMYPAGIIGSLPVLILVLVFQRYIISGLTSGGVKF